LPERRITLHERRAILLQRVEVPPRAECKNDIEVSSSLARRSCDELNVARREHHRRQASECVAHSWYRDTVERHTFLFARAVEADAEVVLVIGAGGEGDVKTALTESHYFLVASSARASQNLEVIDRLEKIRLSLAILADDRESRLGEIKIDALEVSEIANG